MSKKIIYDDDSKSSLFNLDFMTEGKGKGIPVDVDLLEDTSKKRRGRPKKKDSDNNVEQNTEEPVIIVNPAKDLPMSQTNLPYSQTYDQTNEMLQSAISEIDLYSNSVRQELESIKASKTLKNKYNYITDLTSTGSSLIGTKITAIRELNKSITDSHNLELKRMKDTAAAGANEVDDSKYIMDLYNAFMTTPSSSMPQNAFMPNQMSFQSFGSNENGVTALGVSSNGSMPVSENLTPAQNRMRLEQDPNIKTVVVYNSTTGEKSFDARNVVTGEKIYNYPLPDPMFLENVTPYPNEGVARDVNLDRTYPLIVMNDGNFEIY